MATGIGLGISAYMAYKAAQSQSRTTQAGSQPLPTYYQEYQSPQQQQMYGYMQPAMQQMYGGQMPQMQGPTAGWYGDLDPNVRAGIEEPYMRGMEMAREGLAGRGQLGAMGSGETPAFSGAAADVMGQYMQKAAPSMAQTGWGMMQPSMQANWEAEMMPYQMLPSMLPQTYSDLLVGHHPTMQQIQPGAPMPPGYQTQLTNIQTQLGDIQSQQPQIPHRTMPSDMYWPDGTPISP